MPAPIFSFHGITYRYIRSNTKLDGYCKKPNMPKHRRIIAINKQLKGKKELDTNIHEMLHACGWSLDEEWVRDTATDIANALWELGYRKNAETHEKTGEQ